MDRKYGEDQRKAVRQIKNELIYKIEEVFLKTFDALETQGLGDGTIAQLTQELLLSRESAIEILRRDKR